MSTTIRIGRQKLYEQVWTTPIRRLAEDVGVSDVALAKVCRKLRVPRPPRGYWAQVKAGTAPRRPKLPKLKAGESDVFVMQPDRRRASGPGTTREPRPEPPVIPVKRDLEGAHRLVRKTLTALRRGKRQAPGVRRESGEPEGPEQARGPVLRLLLTAQPCSRAAREGG